MDRMQALSPDTQIHFKEQKQWLTTTIDAATAAAVILALVGCMVVVGPTDHNAAGMVDTECDPPAATTMADAATS